MSMSSHCRVALDAQTWRMRSERRHAPRAPIHLQLQVDGVGTAVTRDISANGLYLFIPPRHDTAGPFEIELDLPGCGLRARTVRSGPGGKRYLAQRCGAEAARPPDSPVDRPSPPAGTLAIGAAAHHVPRSTGQVDCPSQDVSTMHRPPAILKFNANHKSL